MGTRKFNAGGNLRWTSILSRGEVEIPLDVSCYRNWDKLWPDEPLGSYCMQTSPFTIPYPPMLTLDLEYFSLTVTLTGFRSPALTNASTSSVWVAENRPCV